MLILNYFKLYDGNIDVFNCGFPVLDYEPFNRAFCFKLPEAFCLEAKDMKLN